MICADSALGAGNGSFMDDDLTVVVDESVLKLEVLREAYLRTEIQIRMRLYPETLRADTGSVVDELRFTDFVVSHLTPPSMEYPDTHL